MRDEPVALHERAADDLRFIRRTMERATSFTGVSGKGFVLAGVTALGAAWLASLQTSREAWLAVWLAELALAGPLVLGLSAAKARREGASLRSHTGRKLLFAFSPPMAVGALLTAALYLSGGFDLLPGVWLGVYGAGVMTGGAYSVRVIPVMGAALIALGGVALLAPVPADLVLALGMGGLHILFGTMVWRRYGG
ncbi:MAG: hypothetical protein ACODAE_10330 [Gemmatimonadota bacterium]